MTEFVTYPGDSYVDGYLKVGSSAYLEFTSRHGASLTDYGQNFDFLTAADELADALEEVDHGAHLFLSCVIEQCQPEDLKPYYKVAFAVTHEVMAIEALQRQQSLVSEGEIHVLNVADFRPDFCLTRFGELLDTNPLLVQPILALARHSGCDELAKMYPLFLGCVDAHDLLLTRQILGQSCLSYSRTVDSGPPFSSEETRQQPLLNDYNKPIVLVDRVAHLRFIHTQAQYSSVAQFGVSIAAEMPSNDPYFNDKLAAILAQKGNSRQTDLFKVGFCLAYKQLLLQAELADQQIGPDSLTGVVPVSQLWNKQPIYNIRRNQIEKTNPYFMASLHFSLMQAGISSPEDQDVLLAGGVSAHDLIQQYFMVGKMQQAYSQNTDCYAIAN